MSEQVRTTEGGITDEAIERLRARIGIPEPHPMAPHYLEPNLDVFRHVAARLRRRQPAVVRSRVRRHHPLAGPDRAARAGGR